MVESQKSDVWCAMFKYGATILHKISHERKALSQKPATDGQYLTTPLASKVRNTTIVFFIVLRKEDWMEMHYCLVWYCVLQLLEWRICRDFHPLLGMWKSNSMFLRWDICKCFVLFFMNKFWNWIKQTQSSM